MTKHTYGVMTGAGRITLAAETVDISDGMIYFKTSGEIVGVVPLHQLSYVFRMAPGTENKELKSAAAATKLRFPASKSRRQRQR